MINLDAFVGIIENLPLINYDGSTGMTLHLDAGQDAASGGWRNGGSRIPDLDNNQFPAAFGFASGPCRYKRDNFAPERRGIFYYGACGKNFQALGGLPPDLFTGEPRFQSDYFQLLTPNTSPLQTAIRPGHELGHCMGLGHGGGDGCNFKPTTRRS